MSWHQSVSGKVVILLTLVFAFTTYNKISKVHSGEKSCLCAYDGFGYYAYLPQMYEQGHLKFEQQWMQQKQNKYCNGAYAYQLEKKDLKNEINIYHMGMSFVLLPSYVLGDIAARIGGYPLDGFSKPYHISYHLNAFLFIFLGLLYLRKLLLFFASDKSTAITISLIALGTNAYFIFNYQYDLPHLYLFTINTACIYHFLKFLQSRKNKTDYDTPQTTPAHPKHLLSIITSMFARDQHSFWFAALLFGLAVCIRPTQLLLGIIPFLLFLKELGRTRAFFKYMFFLGSVVIFCNIPQFLYWKIVGGEWLILNLHTEDMVLRDPNLYNFLFSYRKGWLLYTPLFFLLPFGFWFFYKKNKTLFWGVLGFSTLYIWAMSSWECWWYASSFGQRVMVDIYSLLAIPLVLLIDGLKNRIALLALGITAISCLVLNQFQSEQVRLGILDGHRMTKEHYWLIWGELNPENIHHRYLLIDRSNKQWPHYLSKDKNLPFVIKEREVHKYKGNAIAEPEGAVSLGKIHLYNTFETDETLLEVPIVYTTTDSTQNAVLRMECVSKYNCYSWDNIEVSFGKRKGVDNYDTLRFNLPNIRHKADSMQMYIMSLGKAQVELKEFKINATSLIRH